MEDVDFEDEGAEEPDGEAWETEDDEGLEDGMEAQDDSEVTFSLHSGEPWGFPWGKLCCVPLLVLPRGPKWSLVAVVPWGFVSLGNIH